MRRDAETAVGESVCCVGDACSLRGCIHLPPAFPKTSGLKQWPAPTSVPSGRKSRCVSGSSCRRSVCAAALEPAAAAATSMKVTLEFCAHSASVSPERAELGRRPPWRGSVLAVEVLEESGEDTAVVVGRRRGHDGRSRVPCNGADGRGVLLDHLGHPEIVGLLVGAHGHRLGATAHGEFLLIGGPVKGVGRGRGC
eukprot:scaffold50294_cov27-Tisochrysis_lutea.AAC.2